MTDCEESPLGTVTVSGFYIDRYPVTIGEYVRFLNTGENDNYYVEDMADPNLCGIVKKGKGSYSVIPGKEYYPAVYITPEAAKAYARWAGKRLPTEYEWEIAARGSNARRYPWGNEKPDPGRANYNYLAGHTTPVGSYPLGKTPEGVYDLAGNVWEIVQGRWTPYPWGKMIKDMPAGRQIMRGGSWASPPENIMSTYRSAVKYGCSAMIGFRCARSLSD